MAISGRGGHGPEFAFGGDALSASGDTQALGLGQEPPSSRPRLARIAVALAALALQACTSPEVGSAATNAEVRADGRRGENHSLSTLSRRTASSCASWNGAQAIRLWSCYTATAR